MKVSFHYFSATGNTARAVRLVGGQLEKAGHGVAYFPVKGDSAPPSDIPGLTVVAFPIWSWAAPHFVLNYVRRLPRAKEARAAVLSTCGGFGAQGVEEVVRLLRRRGYRVVCSGEATYPDNWTLAMSPPAGEEMNKQLETGAALVRKFADDLLSGSPTLFHCAFGHKVWSWPIAMLFRLFGRRVMGKAFAADAQCTSCGLCAKACPAGAIRMEGSPALPRWNSGCAACFRCINLCPARSIQVSVARLGLHLGLNLAVTLAWAFSIPWLFGQMEALPPALRVVATVFAALAAYIAACAVQITAIDALLNAMASWMPLRAFFQKNYTRSFGRYRAPGFKPEVS